MAFAAPSLSSASSMTRALVWACYSFACAANGKVCSFASAKSKRILALMGKICAFVSTRTTLERWTETDLIIDIYAPTTTTTTNQRANAARVNRRQCVGCVFVLIRQIRRAHLKTLLRLHATRTGTQMLHPFHVIIMSHSLSLSLALVRAPCPQYSRVRSCGRADERINRRTDGRTDNVDNDSGGH